MGDFTIQKEKLEQAVGILKDKNVDVWMTFVRETAHNADPALALIYGLDVTWQAAFIITSSGRKVAIAGRYDCEAIRQMGGYDEVIPYDQSIQPDLLEVLDKLKPRQLALNYSASDSSADGLSYGMYTTLMRYFQEKPYPIISAEDVMSSLRGRKSPSEIARIRNAVRITEEVIDGVTALLKPGLSEQAIADWVHAEFKRRGVTPSWDAAYCPVVNCGPDSPVGHTSPSSTLVTKAGETIHMDLGVVADDYVSDIQRMWYLQGSDGGSIPEAIQHAFEVLIKAIDASIYVLRPGVSGWKVDAAARAVITEAGFPEFKHALGHHIGRTVHDGSTVLGPRWERYGDSPNGLVEAGNVYTIEPSIIAPGLGIVAIEEDVLVTESGVEWISKPQRQFIIKQV
jgi:Xaa-Pro dipeptidase